MKKNYFLLVLLLLFVQTGCRANPVPDKRISSTWLLTISTPDAGPMKVILEFEVSSADRDTCRFLAYSERDMDKKVLGKWKAMLGRSMGSNFSGGSLIRIVDGSLLSNDSIIAILVSPFGNRYINGRIADGKLDAVLSDGAHQATGSITGSKGKPALPLRNYNAICDSAIAVTERNLYDPALVKTREWQFFKNKIKAIGKFTNDDAALVMGFFYFGKELPFSHFYLLPATEQQQSNDTAADSRPSVALKAINNTTAVLKISSFAGRASEMDSIFNHITNRGYQTLIVDLRDNPGGAIDAGMAFTGHLISDTLSGGIFLTQKYFSAHNKIPEPSGYTRYPAFSEANYKLLLQGISAYPAIRLTGLPRQPLFSGNVYVLINGNTASTCEPIIYELKKTKRAIIVGSKSAGAMLNGETFETGNGYVLTLPTAVYYTSDGFKIDNNGVVPDVETGSKDALDYTLKTLAVQNR